MLTRRSLGFAAALLLALPGCERILGLSQLQRPCDRRTCEGQCGVVDDGCGGAEDCGACAAEGGTSDVGVWDADAWDAGTSDADVSDAGSSDAGNSDADVWDAGTSDAGSASCDDQVQNGSETDVDCGGGDCPACGVGMACQQAIDCGSGLCTSGTCAPAPCSTNNGGCDSNAVCSAGADGGVSCACKAGYQGDGTTCRATCRRPKVMLAVDRSASMMRSIASDSVLCTDVNGDYLPSSPKDCKWKDLRDVLTRPTGLLATTKGAAFYGLAVFPGSDQPNTCIAGTTLLDISDSSDNVNAITTALVNLIPAGGTPTALTLQALANDSQLKQSSDPQQARYVLLVTDGIPNCNPANQGVCEACKAEECGGGDAGQGECTQCFVAPCSATFALYADTPCDAFNACADGDNAVAAVSALAGLGVQTFVVGLGLETSSVDGAALLNRMAIAGGLPRNATSLTRFYQVSTKDELGQALTTFASTYVAPCSP